MKLFFIVLGLLLFLNGCSRRLPPKKFNNNYPKETKLSTASPSTKKTTGYKNTDLQQLYRHYQVWKGTPYRYGGTTQKGVDCSGFVLQAYKKVYHINLPRSTQHQVKKGRLVYKYELKTGDLLFFKTGWNVRHVGIYLEKGKFMHASDSKGVNIASINNPYWKKHYWQTRRLF